MCKFAEKTLNSHFIQMEQLLQFPSLSKIEQYSVDYARHGDDYIFSHLSPSCTDMEVFNNPVRFSGLTITLILSGEISAEIDLKKVTLRRSSLAVLGPSSIISVRHVDWSTINAYVLIFSSQFLHDLNLDANAFNIRALVSRRSFPVGTLTEHEKETMKTYFDLLQHNATDNSEPVLSKNIARSLMQAIIYQMLQFQNNHFGETDTVSSEPHSRRLNYVHDFMQLVRMYHTRERTIAFYADRLFISPKYLSHIIKEATGRSAADWIDQFVVQEAKNMLRFSNKNIQQVAYALNFPTQSSFGKYFKHLTGMSPTEYQKT